MGIGQAVFWTLSPAQLAVKRRDRELVHVQLLDGQGQNVAVFKQLRSFWTVKCLYRSRNSGRSIYGSDPLDLTIQRSTGSLPPSVYGVGTRTCRRSSRLIDTVNTRRMNDGLWIYIHKSGSTLYRANLILVYPQVYNSKLPSTS